MNKITLIGKRREVYNSYHLPSCSHIHKRKINAIFFNPSNSLRHELAKAAICYSLLQEEKHFITEAVDNKTDLRRDIVCLDGGDIFEIEDSKSKRGHRHPPEIRVWWYDKQMWRTLEEAEEG